MLDEAVKTKLRDPDYFALHLQAAAAIHAAGRFPWYDSNFVRRVEAAKLYLAEVRPDALAAFLNGFEPLRPKADFEVRDLKGLFDPETRARILDITRSARPGSSRQDQFERKNFDRLVIWDEPFFVELQRGLTERVSELAGQSLEPGYNFLSLYSGSGVCDPHMDEPYSMYTLDYCIEQSADWPIYFSKIVDWPTLETVRDWDADRLKTNASLGFQSKVLKPNDAVLFAGSSQWHYRDAIMPGGFCSLLFFHYFPAGCEALVTPARWCDHFDIPELGPLCDLFGDMAADGFD